MHSLQHVVESRESLTFGTLNRIIWYEEDGNPPVSGTGNTEFDSRVPDLVGVVDWHHACFGNRYREFDSPHPHKCPSVRRYTK